MLNSDWIPSTINTLRFYLLKYLIICELICLAHNLEMTPINTYTFVLKYSHKY